MSFLKISPRLSSLLSLLLSGVLLAAIGLLAVLFPGLVRTADTAFSAGEFLSPRWAILTLGYGLMTFAAAACVLLIFLLCRVRRGQVFTAESVALLRAVSWCCMGAALLLLLGAIFFPLLLAAGAAAALLGLCLRVMKNVLEEATAIKSENDLTV